MKMQIELPQDFVRLMHEHYTKQEADALCLALETTEPEVSIRLNPRKLSAEAVLAHNPDLEPVPWCPDAFYLKERPAFTFDPLLHAGAYYVQEASSMYIAQIVSFKSPPKGRDFKPFPLGEGLGEAPLLALDLCAAPGGKSTLLQSLLPEGSLLICNEPIQKRAQVLSENMQKWMMGQPESAPQVVVTQNYPADFGALTGQVDILLVDAPCSGEGMFRKDEGARQEWSLENVRMCQQRQRDILGDIWHVLKPGGLLIYSTCTFNRFEDEDNTRYFCDEMGGFCTFERHFLPGRDRGEGFYVAAIKKNHQADQTPRPPLGGEKGPLASLKGDKGIDKLGLRVLSFEGDSFASSKGESEVRIELSYNQALQYLRREALRVEAPRGPVTLCYRGLPLGPGKGVGSRINNLYPEAWRIRTTYTTPYSLLGTEN
jgi:16S rRNA C967 or C1407 C5-methylase (RsmB/RsmF family)